MSSTHWTMRSGERIPIRKMEDSHLCSTLAMLMRNYKLCCLAVPETATVPIWVVYPSFIPLRDEWRRRLTKCKRRMDKKVLQLPLEV